jgi:hypothetical protein
VARSSRNNANPPLTEVPRSELPADSQSARRSGDITFQRILGHAEASLKIRCIVCSVDLRFIFRSADCCSISFAQPSRLIASFEIGSEPGVHQALGVPSDDASQAMTWQSFTLRPVRPNIVTHGA